MKPLFYMILVSILWSGTHASTSAHQLLASQTQFYVKASAQEVLVNEPFYLDFFIEEVVDLYGIQIDVALSLNEGSIPAQLMNEHTPFLLPPNSPFYEDVVFFNQFDKTKEVASLLITRQFSEPSGYTINNVKLIARLSVKALLPLTFTNSLLKVSDDLLSMQLGLTNITIKLSNAAGQKINYSNGISDFIRPSIVISQKEHHILLGEVFHPDDFFSYSDNRTPVEKLLVYVSNFHRVDVTGEYIITISVTDEFENKDIDFLILIVGNPYENIEISYANH